MIGRIAATLRMVAVLALAIPTACGGDPTRVVVVVESEVPLGSVHAQTAGPECERCEHDFALEGPGAVTLPLSFTITPRGGDASRPIRLRIEGRDGSGAAVVARTVRTGFRAGHSVLLRVTLERACVDRACDTDTTCVAGACTDDAIDPATLADVEPGHELDRDAGTSDGGAPQSCGESSAGPITIDPDRDGPIAPFEALCDRGWTLIANVPASGELGYDAPAWVGAPSDATIPPGTGETQIGLFLPYWHLPIDRIRIVMIQGETRREREGALAIEPSITLRDAMSTPGSVAIAFPAPADWPALVGASSDPGWCAHASIGASMRNARVRIGALLGSDCRPGASTDAWFGVAAQAESGGGCTAPASHTGGAIFCGPASQRVPHPARALVYGRAGG